MKRIPFAAPFDAAESTDPARLSLLGHDLRAAVSDVIGGLRLIDRSRLDDGTLMQLERVRTAGETLARLLEQELSLMHGEAGYDPAQASNVHLSRLLHDLQMRWGGRAQEKGLAFHATTTPETPQVLSLDRNALERVLSNVLSNAVKYTDSGAVHFAVDLAPDGALRFVVRDDGPGFSPIVLAGLFEHQGRPDGRGKPGLGLGMHITKDMCARLGGQVSAKNIDGGGAEVTVLLPAPSWTPNHPEKIDSLTLPDLSKIKVLLAEDSVTNQMVIGAMLAALGAEYEIASDGVEAMHWLDREQFDMVLLDIEMPRLSGLEVLRIIRSSGGRQAQMPVLAITAYVLRADREAIYAAGASGILAKPVLDIDIFGQTIARLLGRTREPMALSDDTTDLIDQERFDRLMSIAGPQAGQELLFRLEADLRQVERGLIHALADMTTPDPAPDLAPETRTTAPRTQPDTPPAIAEIRSQTHVLIALAGAVGAVRLQQLAEAMNNAAHQNDAAQVRVLGRSTLPQLDHLIHFITREQTATRPTP